MATKLSVYNLAFAHLSEPTVTSLTEDPVAPNVAKANAQWDQVLDSALARAPWLCATENQSLSLITPPTAGWGDWKYDNRFACPAGTLKVWSVEGYDDEAWQRGVWIDANGAAVTVIKTNIAAPLEVELIVRRPIEALTPLLVDALALLLASRLAGPIQQNEQKAAQLEKAANEAFMLAEGAEASEIGGQDPMIGAGPLYVGRLSAL